MVTLEDKIIDHLQRIESKIDEIKIHLLKNPDFAFKDREAFVKAHMEKYGYITWSGCMEDKKFRELFRYNSAYHRFMIEYSVLKKWEMKKIENPKMTIYYRKDFDINDFVDGIRRTNYRADNPELMKQVKKECLKRDSLNILELLRRWYPHKDDRFRNRAIDRFTNLLGQHQEWGLSVENDMVVNLKKQKKAKEKEKEQTSTKDMSEISCVGGKL